MPLFLVESSITSPGHFGWLRDGLFEAAISIGAELVEARHTADRTRLFQIYEYDDESYLSVTVRLVDHEASVSEVRLVGATVDEVRESAGGNFLTEWDFPDDLTLEDYLEAKAEKVPIYETIDEVTFKRTYVKVDAEGCLCFYDADCAEDVLLARKKVDTPVDRIVELE